MDNRELAVKKKPHKFNITDVFLIAVIIIAALVLVYIVAETGLLGGGDDIYIYYTIDIYLLRNELIPAINRITAGDRITDAVRGNDMGEIQHFRILDGMSNTEDRIHGMVRRVPHPDHSRVQITVRARARKRGPNFEVNGQTIMAGVQLFFRTPHFTGYGNCIDIVPVEMGTGGIRED